MSIHARVDYSHCSLKAGIEGVEIFDACRVKFGAFYDYLDEQHAGKFDRVASGHYARVLRDKENQSVSLALTPDAMKDQTYFLAHLRQEQLARAMFPLGCLTKVSHSVGSASEQGVGRTISFTPWPCCADA